MSVDPMGVVYLPQSVWYRTFSLYACAEKSNCNDSNTELKFRTLSFWK